MLGHLVSNAPRLIRPYMEPILKVPSLGCAPLTFIGTSRCHLRKVCVLQAKIDHQCLSLISVTEFVFSFKALILKLKDPDPNPGVVISVLATIGELAQVRLEFGVLTKTTAAG